MLLNVGDYEREAERALDPGAFGYFAGGSGDELTLRENLEAFSRWQLRPRVLVDVSEVTTATTVLGREVSLPVLVAPTAFQRLAHPDGEVATARAAAGMETVMCQSTLSSVTPGELATAAPGARLWFQLYWSSVRGFTAELLASVVEAGFEALVFTVDFPAAGRRERDLRAAFALPEDLSMPNIPGPLAREGFHAALGKIVDTTLTWRDLEWLRETCPLPLVLKGILSSEDALLATEHGAAGVIVSNHGGRQLDGVSASLDALPEVVESVGERLEVLLDGGVRRGTDVLKALALGARAVLVGRPIVWGLAVNGEDGVREVLELLRAETELGLTQLGCRSSAEVTGAHVKGK
ncbi:MAG: alpha-hydroxy-acid oxidizing protein [Actinobacteria bacterium]|nr:MAG: alpha-hydroxy-acid oxidizing protein [Actinomycetota bacterium]